MGRTSAILLLFLSALLMLISVQAANIGHSTKPCPLGKEYKSCGNRCTQSCDTIGKPVSCIDMCKSGCFCPNGTADDGSGKCVIIQECCKGNTTYSDSGNNCDQLCPSHFMVGIVCTIALHPGCFCKPGYLHQGDRCVFPEDCHKITSKP